MVIITKSQQSILEKNFRQNVKMHKQMQTLLLKIQEKK